MESEKVASAYENELLVGIHQKDNEIKVLISERKKLNERVEKLERENSVLKQRASYAHELSRLLASAFKLLDEKNQRLDHELRGLLGKLGAHKVPKKVPEWVRKFIESAFDLQTRLDAPGYDGTTQMALDALEMLGTTRAILKQTAEQVTLPKDLANAVDAVLRAPLTERPPGD